MAPPKLPPVFDDDAFAQDWEEELPAPRIEEQIIEDSDLDYPPEELDLPIY